MDLESQFPVFRADGKDLFDEYLAGSNAMYYQRLNQARELSIVPQFHQEMIRIMEKIKREFRCIDSRGHPDSSRIEKHFLDSIHQRIQHLQRID